MAKKENKVGGIRDSFVYFIALALVILAGVVVAQNVYHTPDEIFPYGIGTFATGNFTFNNSLFVKDTAGIGTTHPNTTLQINSSNALGAFSIVNRTHQWFFVNNLGRVGIGVASPADKLEVAGAVRFGTDTFTTGQARAYTTAVSGLVLTGEAGTTSDFLITESAGSNLISSPVGTTDVAVENGALGIGLTNPTARLEVTNSSDNVAVARFVASSGTQNNDIVWIGSGDQDGSYNLLKIDYGASYASNAVTVEGDGQVGLGDTNPAYQLDILSAGNGPNEVLNLEDANSGCTFDTDAGTPACVSDERTKKDITEMDIADSLDKIIKLRPVSFRHKNQSYDAPLQYGFIAQDVQKVLPNLVSTATLPNYDFEVLTLDKQDLITWVVGAIKELSHKFGKLEKSTGITIYDTETNEPYCIYIANGKMKYTKGKCPE